jgi:hypothetical protein
MLFFLNKNNRFNEKILAYPFFLSYIAFRAGERSLKKLSGS